MNSLYNKPNARRTTIHKTSTSFWEGLGEVMTSIAQAMIDSGRAKVIADHAAIDAFEHGAQKVSITIDGFSHVYTREDYENSRRY